MPSVYGSFVAVVVEIRPSICRKYLVRCRQFTILFIVEVVEILHPNCPKSPSAEVIEIRRCSCQNCVDRAMSLVYSVVRMQKRQYSHGVYGFVLYLKSQECGTTVEANVFVKVGSGESQTGSNVAFVMTGSDEYQIGSNVAFVKVGSDESRIDSNVAFVQTGPGGSQPVYSSKRLIVHSS